MFVSGKMSMPNSMGVRMVVSSSVVVETLEKSAGIGSRKEEDASSSVVKVGSVVVKVDVVSCVMSCVFVVIELSTEVVEDVSSTFVESVDVMVGVVSSSMSRVLVVKVLLLNRRGTVARVLVDLATKSASLSLFLLLLLLR